MFEETPCFFLVRGQLFPATRAGVFYFPRIDLLQLVVLAVEAVGVVFC